MRSAMHCLMCCTTQMIMMADNNNTNPKKKNTKRSSSRPVSLDEFCNIGQFYLGDIKNLHGNIDLRRWVDFASNVISGPSLTFNFIGEVQALLTDLSLCSSHKEQIKAVQSKKKVLKVSIIASFNACIQSNLQNIDFQWLEDVVLLLFIYLSPSYSSLRSAFEWVVDLLSELQNFSVLSRDIQTLLRISTREVCRIVIESCKHLLCIGSLKDIDVCIQILPSLNCMALLQKDNTSWITIDNVTVEDDMLLFFVGFLIEILCRVVEDILAGVNITQHPTSSNAEANISAMEVVRPTECCNDCLRIIVTILKSWKWRSTVHRRFHAFEWGAILDRSVTGICNLLKSGLVSKDAGTNLALGAVVLQRFSGSMREDSTFSLSYYQLLSTLYLLQEQTESDSNAFSYHAGLHLAWVQLVPTLPLLLKVAVLRACLSIFDVTVLTYVPISRIHSPSDPYKHSEEERSTRYTISSWLCDEGYQKNEEITQTESLVILYAVNKQCHGPLLYGAVLTSLVEVCSDPVLPIKLYGLQTLESWLTRVAECYSERALVSSNQILTTEGIENVLTSLNALAGILCMAWSHPARQVNHVVPAVYQRLLAAASAVFSHPLVQHQAATTKDFFFAKLKHQALDMPATHRGRYQALALLLPKIGAKDMLHHTSTTASYTEKPLLLQLIEAVRERDVASSSSSLVASILKSYFLESSNTLDSSHQDRILSDIRSLWGDSFALSICSPDSQIRKNSADYLLPELLKTDSTCGPFVVSCIRRLYNQQVQSSPLEDGNLRVLFLWGLLNVFLQVRVLGFVGGDIVDSTSQYDGLKVEEIEEAAICANDDVRLCAIVALTTSLKSSTPLSSSELEVLRKCLPFSLKAFQADQRHQVVRAVKSLVMRLSEHNRGCVRDVDSLRTGKRKFIQLSQLTSHEDELPPDRSAKIEAFDVDILRLESCISGANEAMLWLREELLDKNLYPGSSPDREMTSLDVLRCVFESATVSATKASQSKQQSLLTCFTASESVVQVLLNVLLSSWDRSRRLAADLLLCLSRPLAGFESLESVQMLIRWAFRLASKAKLRESDAGAILLRDIFTVYSFHLSWSLYLPDILVSVSMSSSDAISNSSELLQTWQGCNAQATHKACAAYILSLNQIIDHRLNSLARLFTSMNLQDIFSLPTMTTENVLPNGEAATDVVSDKADVPFTHGLLLSLRYCLQSAFESNMFQDKSSLEGSQLWAATIKCIYQTTLKALDIAMTVVAEASSDTPFAPIFGDEHSSTSKTVGSKGPINASSGYGPGTVNNEQDDNLDMAASYINANSVMDGDGMDTISGDDIQRVVVAAWLVVKEASAMLAFLVEISPPMMEVRLLSDDDIATAGYTLLDNLSRLKHMGAIAETHTALQNISCILLRYGDKNKFLGRLPLAWLNKLLQRLRGDQQVFILRRSAGFAYSFLSLLRAEPVDCDRTLLPVAMESLLSTIKLGIHKNCNTVHWKLCVHSMNVLRLLISDATVGPALNQYITQCVQYSVQGFESDRWAVRNSSMMVFTAVVQRSVDVDKNDSGGSSAATATEFFLRFPALYPFLLGELARILKCSIQLDHNSWPTAVALNKTLADCNTAEVLHPSLYPLLLFLSKMRAPLTSDTALTSTGVQINCLLFIPVLESCCSQKVFQVRVMVSKAIASLVPLEVAVSKAVSILKDMITSMTGPAFLSQPTEMLDLSFTPKFQFNVIHGSLMIVRELLWNIKRHSNAAADSAFVHGLLMGVQTDIVPALERTIMFLRKASCSAVHLELLKVLLLIREMHSHDSPCVDVVTDLLLRACTNALKWNHVSNRSVVIDSVKETSPFDVLLWRCALEEIVWASLCWSYLASSDFSQLKSPRPVDFIVQYLDSHISEVREGVLNGLIRSIRSNQSERYLVTCLDQVLWLKLLDRCSTEKEPPALHLTLLLLCRLSELTQVHDIVVQSSFQEGFSIIAAKVCGNPTALVSKQHMDLSSNILDTPASACALELLGWLVGLLARNADLQSALMIDSWLRLIECCSDEAQTATLREAVCLSMKKAFTHLLDSEANRRDVSLLERTDILLRIWLLLLRLLQDDDEDVRQHANSISFSLNSVLQLVPTHYARTVAVNEIYTLEALPDFIAATITRAMTRSGADHPEEDRPREFLKHFQYLLNELRSILGTEDMMVVILNTDFDRLSNKIFEAEQANLFIEPLKSAAALCDALVGSIHGNMAAIAPVLPALIAEVADIGCAVTRVLSRAALVVNRKAGREEDSSFIGGLTYQKDIFRYCYVYLRLVNGILSTTTASNQLDESSAECANIARSELVELVKEELIVKKLATNEVSRVALERSMHPWIARNVYELLGDNKRR